MLFGDCAASLARGAAQLVGRDYTHELSNNSLERAMVISAHRVGINFRDIKKQSAWSHDDTVQGYIEEAGLFEENVALNL